jgi:hypothetical protein
LASVPDRQLRALYSDTTITVYQAYPRAIADPAVAAGRFVPPFRLHRMTWVKPSLLRMAYRSGWATKPGQVRVLAVEITRAGFEWALARAALTHYEPGVHPSREAWESQAAASPCRVQWDPERGLRLQRLTHRTLQLGLAGPAVHHYVNEWTVSLTDITPDIHQIHDHVAAGSLAVAQQLLPIERPYPLPPDLARRVGASCA